MDILERLGRHWLLIVAGVLIIGLLGLVIIGLPAPGPITVFVHAYVGWLWIIFILAIIIGLMAMHPPVHAWMGGAQNARSTARTLGNWLVGLAIAALIIAVAMLAWPYVKTSFASATGQPTAAAQDSSRAPVVASHEVHAAAVGTQPACADASRARAECDFGDVPTRLYVGFGNDVLCMYPTPKGGKFDFTVADTDETNPDKIVRSTVYMVQAPKAQHRHIVYFLRARAQDCPSNV